MVSPCPQSQQQTWHMGIARKLEGVGQVLNSMTTQNVLTDFFNNPENAQGLNSLVEDIHYALMDYQVCVPEPLALIISNIQLRLHYNETSTTKAVRSWVSYSLQPGLHIVTCE